MAFDKPRRRKGAKKVETGKGTDKEWAIVNRRLKDKYGYGLTPATKKVVKQLMDTGLSRAEALKRVDK
jgi:hypothetical protein